MSKGLEAFNKFCDSVNICVNSGGITNINLIAKQQVEKELKALEIIKNTDVEIWKIRKSVNYKEYSEDYCLSNIEYLTQEEYDLLKEVLLW